jgi:hypothetical protein
MRRMTGREGEAGSTCDLRWGSRALSWELRTLKTVARPGEAERAWRTRRHGRHWLDMPAPPGLVMLTLAHLTFETDRGSLEAAMCWQLVSPGRRGLVLKGEPTNVGKENACDDFAEIDAW